MGSISQKLLIYVVLIAYLHRQVSADWNGLENGTFTLPAHAYKLEINSRQTIYLNLNWDIQANMNMYIFRSGSNLYNLNEFRNRCSANNSKSCFCSIFLEVDRYFLRIVSNNLRTDKLLQYKLQITASGIKKIYSGIFHGAYASKAVIPINNSPQHSQSYTLIKFQTNQTLKSPATFITEQENLRSDEDIKFFNISSSSNSDHQWFLVIQDTLTSAYSINTVNYFLSYLSCPLNYSIVQYECVKNNNHQTITNNILVMAIVISIVGLTIIAGIVGLGIFCYRKNKGYLYQKNDDNSHNYFSKDNTVGQIKQDIKKEDLCSICLDVNCDKILKCKHAFHRKCIQEWFNKNRNCPLCRNLISALPK